MGETVQHGPYEGLSKNHSAIEVEAAIQEQFNATSTIYSDGVDRERVIERELRRQGMYKTGVRYAVADGLDHLLNAERQYEEILNVSKAACRRSDLTTTDSFRLYTSPFDFNTELSTADQIFLLGKAPEDSRHNKPESQPCGRLLEDTTEPTQFAKKAACFGIQIAPRAKITDMSTLFAPPRRIMAAPNGFEQIKQDLFSKKDNQYMVFNGAGVSSWMQNEANEPITKL